VNCTLTFSRNTRAREEGRLPGCGERCDYSERCVVPLLRKKDPGFVYGLELEKVAILAQRNQQVSEASPTRTVGIKESKTTKKSLKTKG